MSQNILWKTYEVVKIDLSNEKKNVFGKYFFTIYLKQQLYIKYSELYILVCNKDIGENKLSALWAFTDIRHELYFLMQFKFLN